MGRFLIGNVEDRRLGSGGANAFALSAFLHTSLLPQESLRLSLLLSVHGGGKEEGERGKEGRSRKVGKGNG